MELHVIVVCVLEENSEEVANHSHELTVNFVARSISNCNSALSSSEKVDKVVDIYRKVKWRSSVDWVANVEGRVLGDGRVLIEWRALSNFVFQCLGEYRRP